MSSPNAQKAEGTWKKFKGKIQEKWGDLRGDNLDRFKGNRKQLEGHIQKKTGEAREDVRKEIDRLSDETKHKI